MRRFGLLLLLSLSFAWTLQSSAETVEMAIATGTETGTYYQFGKDMSELAQKNDIALSVLPSRGSVENIIGLYDSRSIQLAIAQSDALIFMAMLGDAKTRAIVQDIRVIYPLYQEEVHLLAREGVDSFEDLAGKRLAIGLPGSGSAMTANVFLALAEIEPSETLEIGGPEALELLRNDQIDALFFVAGQPVKLFSEDVTKDDNLHLVPITTPTIVEKYGTPTQIPSSAYEWMNEDVSTVGIKAGLMTLDYPSENVNCRNVRAFSRMLWENIDLLKETGHPKWKAVDLREPVSDALIARCGLPE